MRGAPDRRSPHFNTVATSHLATDFTRKSVATPTTLSPAPLLPALGTDPPPTPSPNYLRPPTPSSGILQTILFEALIGSDNRLALS